MDTIETTETATRTAVARRVLIKGAAWSVPAVTVLSATPAFAATNTVFAFTDLSPAVINAANPNDSVTVSGTGPDNATVTITIGGTTFTTPVAAPDGKWSYTIPAASLPDGSNVEVTATISTGGSATQTYTKDTVAPAPTISAATTFEYSASTELFTVKGTAGTVASPTVDATSVTLALKVDGVDRSPVTITLSGAAWSYTFTGVGNNKDYTLTVTQEDGAGNVGTASHTGKTGKS
ncbi:hypothetical protein [Aestuariimicrobium sp. Y1814]|uniref:hypothetical protein n=1 Tax=Aestuariimicrobium sp. Y1814 TaxID=3418742 RepID=UPI003DA73699